MRLPFLIVILWLSISAMHAQDVTPTIVGQKELSTETGKPITIRLTDLYVEETPVQADDDESNGGGEGDNDNGGDDSGGETDEGESDDSEGDENEGETGDGGGGGNEGGDDDDADNEDNKDDDGDDDNTDGGDDDGGKDGKDKKDDKGKGEDKKGDKGKGDDSKGNKGKGDDDKENKGNKGDKGGGNGKGKDSKQGEKYPDGYTLVVLEGKNYTLTGTTILPKPGFSGVLSIPVRVRNAKYASPIFTLKITVIPSADQPNEPPVIVGQSPLSTSIGTPLIIKLSDLQVSDPDDQYPVGFTLNLQPGENYKVDGLAVTPAEGFSGKLAVPATVNDGESSSAVFNLSITVVASEPENVPPTITGQLPLSISVNQSVKVELAHLLVTDPDDEYPGDFALKLFSGAHYTVDGAIVIPQQNFTGDLFVHVSVSDGTADSDIFKLKITVTPGVNVKPVITGQAGLSVLQGQSVKLTLSHLVVQDPDNRYPDDFTLIVSAGNNYAVSTHTITPQEAFLGTLTVGVSVHDGKVSSDPFDVKIEVIERDRLQIVGQKTITVQEDSSVAIDPRHFTVNDPSNRYPEGFTIRIHPGEHYEVKHNRIIPARDFYGNLTVPVTISQGTVSTAPFFLLVVVEPVNDPPEIVDIPLEPVVVNGRGSWSLFAGAVITDVDDEHMLFAEIGFREGMFAGGQERIGFDPVGNLHVVFDESAGVLYIVGRAPLSEYQSLMQSITYEFYGSPDSLLAQSRSIYVKLNDGKSTSAEYERVVTFDTGVNLEIPSAFTPNNDNANDTWTITPLQEGEQINTFIRVYDKSGTTVFESNDLQRAWDGHHNGFPLPADVYFYTIEIDLSYRKISYKGIVSILR